MCVRDENVALITASLWTSPCVENNVQFWEDDACLLHVKTDETQFAARDRFSDEQMGSTA